MFELNRFGMRREEDRELSSEADYHGSNEACSPGLSQYRGRQIVQFTRPSLIYERVLIISFQPPKLVYYARLPNNHLPETSKRHDYTNPHFFTRQWQWWYKQIILDGKLTPPLVAPRPISIQCHNPHPNCQRQKLAPEHGVGGL